MAWGAGAGVFGAAVVPVVPVEETGPGNMSMYLFHRHLSCCLSQQLLAAEVGRAATMARIAAAENVISPSNSTQATVRTHPMKMWSLVRASKLVCCAWVCVTTQQDRHVAIRKLKTVHGPGVTCEGGDGLWAARLGIARARWGR